MVGEGVILVLFNFWNFEEDFDIKILTLEILILKNGSNLDLSNSEFVISMKTLPQTIKLSGQPYPLTNWKTTPSVTYW